MLEVLKRNQLLIVVFCTTLLLFFSVTLPAVDREGELARRKIAALRQLEKLRREAAIMELQVEAIRQNDPALLERVVRSRLQLGEPGGAAR